MRVKTMINGFYGPPWAHERRRDREHFGKQERAYRALLDCARYFPTKVDEIVKNRDLTDIGKQRAVRDLVKNLVVPQLADASDALNAAGAYASQRRASLTMADPDKGNVAAALVRGEIRALYRSMDPAERTAKVMMASDMEPSVALALLEGPAVLSGLTREQHARLRDRALLGANPEAGEELLALEDAGAAVTGAMRAVTKTVQKIGNVSEREFGELLGAPTLKDRIAALLAAATDEPEPAANAA